MKSIEDIADKMERIVRVIYMATEHLSHRNEIRINIRNSALSVMAGVIDLASNNVYDAERDLQASIYKTMSYIKIAMSDKSMSDTNGQILLSAYVKLLSFISNINLTDNTILTDNIKDIEFTPPPTPNSPMWLGSHIDSQGYGTNQNSNSKRKINTNSTPALPPNSAEATMGKQGDGATQSNNKNERREKILNIIKTKSQNNLDTNGLNINTGCSMSDLLIELTDMNEKMIQRELMSMVTDQIVVKRGEKRWSRYVLSHSTPSSVILV